MNRKAQIIAVAVLAGAILAATGWNAVRHHPLARDGQAFRDITDMTGQRVRVPVVAHRVLSLCTTATDTLLGLGLSDRLAAIDEFSLVVPGSHGAAVIGKGSAVSREQISALQIDLAFVWWYQDDAAAMLKGLGVPVVCIRSGRASELPATIRLIGDCLDRRQAAERLAQRIEAFVTRPATRPDGNAVRVFLELYGPFKTAGRDTYTNDLLEMSGCVNVAAETKGTVVFSAERLVEADPDVVMCVGEASDAAAMSQRPGIRDLRAVRQGHVIAIDRHWLVAGPNMPQSVEKIRAAIGVGAAKAVKE